MGMVDEPISEPIQRSFAAYVGDAALIAIVSLATAFVLASFSASGTLTMGLAFALLAFAFLIIVGGTFAVGHLWKTTKTHKAIVAAIAAICLFLIGIYEWRNFTPPLTATDIATAVVDKIKTTPANGSETPSSSPHAVQPSIVAPEALPSGPIGVLLDNSDHITFSGSSIESSGTAVVARNSSDITFDNSRIRSGVRDQLDDVKTKLVSEIGRKTVEIIVIPNNVIAYHFARDLYDALKQENITIVPDTVLVRKIQNPPRGLVLHPTKQGGFVLIIGEPQT
jgi:hypothetical protein